MPNVTISYSPSTQGWTSRWSYNPDWMTGMGNTFYTWNKGCLYEHDSNASRNTFYGVSNPSTMTTIFNSDPLSNKMFKTISIDSTHPWDVDAFSDLEDGLIDSTYFVEKEGGWFAHIRRDNNIVDLKSMSTQGIGGLQSINVDVLTFGFKISTSVSVGDSLYKVSGGALVAIGTVGAHTATTITVSGLTNAPISGDVIVLAKNSQAESYGIRGYFMEISMSNDSTDDVELFSVTSSAFKSNP
jgi:hypothetical protein